MLICDAIGSVGTPDTVRCINALRLTEITQTNAVLVGIRQRVPPGVLFVSSAVALFVGMLEQPKNNAVNSETRTVLEMMVITSSFL